MKQTFWVSYVKILLYALGPKPLRRLKLRLKRLQRQLSRKEKGSKNRNKARMKVSKIHYRIACIRHDALHKPPTHLTDNFASIAIEDLNVKGMMSNNRFAGSIANAAKYLVDAQPPQWKLLNNGKKTVIASGSEAILDEIASSLRSSQ